MTKSTATNILIRQSADAINAQRDDVRETLLHLVEQGQASVERAARRNRLVAGSKEQPVLSPLLGYVLSLDAEIRQLEDRFGLTPRARLQLGVTFGEAHRSLAELNAAFMEEQTLDDDPRHA